MEIGGESEGQVREKNTRSCGIDVFAESTRDDSPGEGDRNRGDEAEEETKDGDRNADRCRHGIHVHQFHGVETTN